MIDLIIVGAGGFAREVYQWTQDWINAQRNRQNEYRIKGFLSLDPDILNPFSLPVGILADENTYEVQDHDRFIMGIGTVKLKKVVTERLKKKNAQFFNLIHPSAIVCPTATVGEGAVICPFSLISANVTVGDFAMFNIYSSAGHDATVGDFCVLSPYATLNGFAKLDDEVFMGSHSTVVASKSVGHQSKISANTLVVSNIPPKTTVLGSQGKTIPNL